MKPHKYGNYIASGVTAFFVIAAAILLFFFIYHFGRVWAVLSNIAYILRPIFYGVVLAFLLLPIHRRSYGILMKLGANWPIERVKKEKIFHSTAILLSLLFAFLVVYILLAMVLPQVYLSIVGLVEAFPEYIKSMQAWLLQFLSDNPAIQETVMPYYNSIMGSVEQWMNSDLLPNLESVNSTLAWIREWLLPQLTGVVSSVSAGLLSALLLLKDLLIAIIVSVYLLGRKDIFAAQSKKIAYSVFRTDIADFLVEETRHVYQILSGFINGKLLDSLIIGIISLICCNIFQFPYPVLLAVVIGVTNIIPFFGPFIGAIPCGLLIFLVSPIKCLYFAIFILVLQQFDGNILGPKILGDSTGLASFWVLFSILLFGGLFGFAGMVLGVPVFAMFYSCVSRLVRYGLRRRGLPEDTMVYIGKTESMVSIEEKKA